MLYLVNLEVVENFWTMKSEQWSVEFIISLEVKEVVTGMEKFEELWSLAVVTEILKNDGR